MHGPSQSLVDEWTAFKSLSFFAVIWYMTMSAPLNLERSHALWPQMQQQQQQQQQQQLKLRLQQGLQLEVPEPCHCWGDLK